jgi:lipopolysaccharide heptosyltransferase II
LKEPSRILVVRTDRLGDVVLTLPVFAALRRCFPGAQLAMLAGCYAGAIVEGYAPVDEILWYDDAGGLIPFRVMMAGLRAGRFDAAVIVHPTPRLALLAFLAGIPVRIGTGYRYYSFLFNRRVYAHRKTAERHEVEYNLDLLAPLGCAAVPRKPLDVPLNIPPEARKRASALLENAGVRGRFVVMHPGSGGSAREWPLEHFGLLSRLFIERMNLAVVVTGTGGESARVGEVARASSGRAVNLAGQLSVKELAALLETASLLIANSTGPLHVGVAVGTPVVGLYPQIPVMGPRRWGPYTDNARVLVPERPPDCDECAGSAGIHCACMASITVETVYAAAADLLAAPALTEETSHP